MIDSIRDNFGQNVKRVKNLVITYEAHPDAKGSGRKKAETLDILRAAVVLLHATLEDLLRGVAYWKLPSSDAKVLNEIPLVGQGANPKKFLLGELAIHRGKQVDEILTESVYAHLEQSNYNNTRDISTLLTNVSVDVTKVNNRFVDLQDLMNRRHQIVHRADRKEEVRGSGDHAIRAINKDIVRSWIEAVEEFGRALFVELGAV